jgi:hypothetical protein
VQCAVGHGAGGSVPEFLQNRGILLSVVDNDDVVGTAALLNKAVQTSKRALLVV